MDDSYSLHRFLSEYRDLVNWINDMKQIISADDLAKDVAGAEALLERHQEHKGEIDAREDSFKLISDSGSSLVERNHFAASEIAEKLNTLNEEKIVLLSLWEDRRVLYEQCMDLQLFYRDTEQADTWMAKQEVVLLSIITTTRRSLTIINYSKLMVLFHAFTRHFLRTLTSGTVWTLWRR